MNFLMNRVYLEFKCVSVNKVSDGYRLVGDLIAKKNIGIVVYIKRRKLLLDKLEQNKIYKVEGYLKSNKFMHQGDVNLVEVTAESISEISFENNSKLNRVELVGIYRSKGETVSIDEKEVAEIELDWVSPKLIGSDVKVSVWNQIIKVFDYTPIGTKVHLSCFIKGHHLTDKRHRQIWLSAVSVTAI